MEKLSRLVILIDDKLAAAGDRTVLSYAQQRVAGHAILAELASKEGASFNDTGNDYSLRLAGIRSTCTHGHFGLLRNWQASARRRIEQAGA